MALTADDVASLARLARIELTEAELEVLAPQLDVILESVAEGLRSRGTGHPADLARALPLTNVFRDDELRPSLPRDQILAAAPAAELMRFRVPRILGGGVSRSQAATPELIRHTAVDLAAKIKSGELSAVEVARAYS